MKNNYFDNKEITKEILEFYETDSEALKTSIMIKLIKLANAIMHVYKYYRFEPYEDVYGHIMLQFCDNLNRKKFDPNRGSAFNYFSRIAKYAGFYYTKGRQKHRQVATIEEYTEEYRSRRYKDNHLALDIEDFVTKAKTLFGATRNKKFHPLLEIFKKYLLRDKEFHKRTFFKIAKEEGWSPNLIRRFLKLLKENKEMFYDNYGNHD